jgi:hypothetical protein
MSLHKAKVKEMMMGSGVITTTDPLVTTIIVEPGGRPVSDPSSALALMRSSDAGLRGSTLVAATGQQYQASASDAEVMMPTYTLNDKQLITDCVNYEKIKLRTDKHRVCIMCGKDNSVVEIHARHKNVCNSCTAAVWHCHMHNVLIKYCSWCKNFRPLGTFENSQRRTCIECGAKDSKRRPKTRPKMSKTKAAEKQGHSSHTSSSSSHSSSNNNNLTLLSTTVGEA